MDELMQKIEENEEFVNDTTEEQELEEDVQEEVVLESVSEEEEKNLGLLDREALVSSLEAIFAEGKLQEAKNKVAILKVNYIQKTKTLKNDLLEAFVTEGGNKIDFEYSPDPIEDRYAKINAKIREFHTKQREEYEAKLKENLEKKMAVLDELRKLIETDHPLKATYDEFNRIKDSWKEIGQVARNESNNLWQSYHFLVEKFFDKVRISNELRDLDYKRNLEQKIQLCEKVEELMLEESLNKAFKSLQALHEQWKEIGPVSLEKKDEVWERFKVATDQINAKRKQYYEDLREELEQNRLAKQALCEQAEAKLKNTFESVKDWNNATKEIEEMLDLWKKIGRAPANVNDEIWECFRTYINRFYANRKAFFAKRKDEYQNNYHLKLDLCNQAEHIAKERSDFRAATEEILQLQKQWKEIGPVSRKVSDKIWARFRAACDGFFAKKAEHHQLIKGNELQNMEAKKALIEEIKALEFGDEKEANLAKIKEIQRRWTEIGHVPIHEKDKIYQEFREVVNAKFENLGIKQMSHRRGIMGKVSGIAASSDAHHLSSNDLRQLSLKINGIREEIQLWENNIGFLAKSKNADILRQEIERKIQKAKQDLALLEAKQKIIRGE